MSAPFDEAENDHVNLRRARAYLLEARYLVMTNDAAKRQELEALLMVAIGDVDRLLAKQGYRPR